MAQKRVAQVIDFFRYSTEEFPHQNPSGTFWLCLGKPMMSPTGEIFDPKKFKGHEKSAPRPATATEKEALRIQLTRMEEHQRRGWLKLPEQSAMAAG